MLEFRFGVPSLFLRIAPWGEAPPAEALPPGHLFVVADDGARLVADDGAYLIVETEA